MKFLFIASCLVGLMGCASDTDDSMYITGTEELAVKTHNGAYVCPSPKKVLICHIPPGNPDNAHTICVGAAAVDPHEEQHGDFVGACDGEDVDPDAGEPEDPPDDPPDDGIDAGTPDVP